MKNKQKEIFGLLLILVSLLSIVSLFFHNIKENPWTPAIFINHPLGLFGASISWGFYWLLGYTSIIFSFVLLIIGYVLFANKKIKNHYKDIYIILLSGIWVSVFISYIGSFNSVGYNNEYADFSGVIGHSLFVFLNDIMGFYGLAIILIFSLIFAVSIITKISLYELAKKLYRSINTILMFIKKMVLFVFSKVKKIKNIKFKKQSIKTDLSLKEKNDFDESSNKESETIKSEDIVVNNTETNIETIDGGLINEKKNISENVIDENDHTNQDQNVHEENILIEEEIDVIKGNLDSEQSKGSNYFNYKLPSTDFLDEPTTIIKQNEEDLIAKGKQLKYALDTFGVNGEVVKISPGPIISLFEVEPAEGVRVNKFVNLSDDLARVMKAQRVRIIAPIPGSKSVGIELPNENISIVYLKNILNSTKYIESKSKLTIALGKTTSGDAYVFDLCKMPHLLVAGATGSGKSVCINTIILSVLYKSKPDEVKFILMDPKKIELSTYKALVGYHLITAPNLDEYVMTTAENAVGILNSAITEMERRFQIFSDARVRNIEEYHNKQKLNNELEKVPYIVVIIDELADLMMTSGRAVEEPITRLAQKARAVGMHLVVATQRPSVDVITGLIKSNFPSRISFLVSSKIDSRTILDQMGAEKLLGRGDMLFLLPGSSSLERLHNAYVTLEEIEKVMEHISKQPKPDEIQLPEVEKKSKEINIEVDENKDELLQKAAYLVVENQQASVSLLQRKFRIGYSRAGRLVDELESLGIVSGYSGSKAREVLVDLSYLDEIFDD